MHRNLSSSCGGSRKEEGTVLPPRYSEFCSKQTTQCLGIREVLWVAENQVNIFEKTFKLGTVQW